jgi:hypothetical protein
MLAPEVRTSNSREHLQLLASPDIFEPHFSVFGPRWNETPAALNQFSLTGVPNDDDILRRRDIVMRLIFDSGTVDLEYFQDDR